MWIFLTVLCIIILFIICILCQRWRFYVIYKGGILSVRLGRLKIYSSYKKDKKKQEYIKIPKISFDDVKKKFSALRGIYKDEKHEIISILNEFQRKLDFKTFNVSVTFGFGDAALTAIANGFIWTGISGAAALLQRHIDIKDKMNIALSPQYTRNCFETDILVVFDTRFIKLFGILIRLRRLYTRNKGKIEGGA